MPDPGMIFARIAPVAKSPWFSLLGIFTISVALTLFSGCSRLFYQPDRVMYYPPAKMGYEARELSFASRDGTKLVGWYFKAKPNLPVRGTLVQFHGNAENISSHYLSLVWLTNEGYNVFAFDYRGYGGSEGEPSQKDVYLDGMAALDEAWRLRSGPRFIVYGQSLGGAVAMRAFKDFSHQAETSLVVLDSTFMSYKTIARRFAARFWLTWPISWLAPLLVSNEYGSEQAIHENKARLLVIHDERDPVVPHECGEEIFEVAKASPAKAVDFWTLSDGRHVEVFAPYNIQWRRKFIELLRSID